MQKKAFIVIGILLAVIICMQAILISKVDKAYERLCSNDAFICDHLDHITSNQYKIMDEIDKITEDPENQN